MTTFAPLSFMHQARCGVSSFLFVSNLPGKYIIYFPSAVNMSVRSHLFLSLLCAGWRFNFDANYTVSPANRAILLQNWPIAGALLPIYSQLYLYIRQPALLSLLQLDCFMRRALWKQSLKHLSPQTDLCAVWVIFLVHTAVYYRRRGSNCTFNYCICVDGSHKIGFRNLFGKQLSEMPFRPKRKCMNAADAFELRCWKWWYQ